MLGSVYQEYLQLKKLRGIPTTSSKTEEIKEDADMSNFFFYLEEAEWQKPIWCSYTHEMRDIRTLVHNLPSSISKPLLKRQTPTVDL